MTTAPGVAGGTVADTNQHYDQDPRIFTLFLDESHKYSSALYGSPDESLDAAQRRKLHFVADRLGALAEAFGGQGGRLGLLARDGEALVRVQEAAERFRRSAVATPLEGDERRIFDAVVKPERLKANGNVEAERTRLRAEIARAATAEEEAPTEEAGAAVSEASAEEADAAPEQASKPKTRRGSRGGRKRRRKPAGAKRVGTIPATRMFRTSAVGFMTDGSVPTSAMAAR